MNKMIRKAFLMNNRQAQFQGLFFAMPPVILFGTVFRLFLRERAVMEMENTEISAALIVILVVSVFLHEGLHGLGWMFAGKRRKGQIKFKIKGLMPMCSCGAEPMKVLPYLTGVLLPLLVLGGASVIWLFVQPGTLSLLTVLVNVVLAGADTAIAFQVLKSEAVLIEDAEDAAGFYGWYKTTENR